MCCRRKKKFTRDAIYDERSHVFPHTYQPHYQTPQPLPATVGSKQGTKEAGGRGRKSARKGEKSKETGKNGINRYSYEHGYHKDKRSRRDDDTLRQIPMKMPEYDAEEEPSGFEQKCNEILRQQFETLRGESDNDKESENLTTPAAPTVPPLSQKTSQRDKSQKKGQLTLAPTEKTEIAPKTLVTQDRTVLTQDQTVVTQDRTIVTQEETREANSYNPTVLLNSVKLKDGVLRSPLRSSTGSKKDGGPSGSANNSRLSDTDNIGKSSTKVMTKSSKQKKSEVKTGEKIIHKSKS